jgi:AraC family transcriptional regulator
MIELSFPSAALSTHCSASTLSLRETLKGNPVALSNAKNRYLRVGTNRRVDKSIWAEIGLIRKIGLIMVNRQEESSLKEVEALQNCIPVTPSETSKGTGWRGLQALRYRTIPAGGEFSRPPVPLHAIVLHLRPPKKFNLQVEGLKLDRPLPKGSIYVVPAGSPLRLRWQGSPDVVVTYLEPSIVARVATHSFEFDSKRMVVPPFHSPNAPGLRSAILAVYAELKAGGGGGEQLLVESLATILSVHLIRHITGPPRLPILADGVLPRGKLRAVIEYIMENLEGSPTLRQMAGVAHLSPYHFARQFKAATGLAPHQYVIARRVERAQHLLQKDDKLKLAEVALRAGFSDQSKFCFHFKRIVGVTPGQFRTSARIT